MNFDADRNGSGTAEWADVTYNIQIGCANGCLYCYAADKAAKMYGGWCERHDWTRERLTKRAVMKSYPARDGVIMFPSTHDITPFNVEAYISVAKLMLAKGNRLLIVSKPRIECVMAMISQFELWKHQVLFRFTIGSMDEATCAFWEPGAPTPGQRLSCLQAAFKLGYRTSVSIEPMLAGALGAYEVVQACRPFVTDTIWIGKMNKVRLRVPVIDRLMEDAIACIEHLQADEEILSLHGVLKDDPMIRWKDSIKLVLANHCISA